MKTLSRVFLVLCCLSASTATVARENAEQQALALQGMKSALWLQTAAEYEALTIQAYAAAAAALPEALADEHWSAYPGQTPCTPALPPAIIMDVDETVLGNARFQGYLIKQGVPFSPGIFRKWVETAQSPAVAGAQEFIKAATKHGVTVFFVTNRDAGMESATRRNLARLGFPLESGFDNVLMRNERPDWTRDKASRRALIAEKYRILMLFGDDLNDFTSAANNSVPERSESVTGYSGVWGRQWFILPNPAYGSWEQALYGFRKDLDAGEKLRLRMQHLQDSGS